MVSARIKLMKLSYHQLTPPLYSRGPVSIGSVKKLFVKVHSSVDVKKNYL